MRPAPGAARAIWLLARLRLTRQANQLSHLLLGRFKKKPRARDGNAGRARATWILPLLVVLVMTLSLSQLARTAILNLQCQLAAASVCRASDGTVAHVELLERAATQLHAAPIEPAVLNGLTMELTILFAVAVMLPLAGKELTQPDWDLEWIATLPLKRSTLLWGRVLERAASNRSGMVVLIPAYMMIAWYAGLRWGALPVALLATALLLPLAALLHTIVDTGLRMCLPTSQLRNLQAAASLIVMPLMYFAMALGMPNAAGFMIDLARGFPSWAGWAPPGLLLRVMQVRELSQFAWYAGLLLAQVGVLLWAGVALLRYQLRDGVVGSGARDSARAKAPALRTSASASASASASGRPAMPSVLASFLSPIQRRELRLLGRDRNFLVQTLLVPLVVVGSQIILNGTFSSIGDLGHNHPASAAIAFGLGVYVLMLSAFQTINNEGQSLWLLYTFPHSLEEMLKQKARLWGVLAMAYPLVVIGVSAWHSTRFDWPMLVLALSVLAGIPIYSMIAVSLGVFASDPNATEARSRLRPSYAYLYMMLAGFYTWSIYSSVWSQKLVVTVLVAALALALWQKARDALPYLLDRGAAPPPRVSASDGLIGATAFFIIQAVIVAAATRGRGHVSPGLVTMAFGAAGLLVYGVTRLIYWRGKTSGVPRILGGGGAPSLRYAAIGATIACLAGLGWMFALRQLALWPDLGLIQHGHGAALWWMLALAVLAAPLCEEFIFRGLIYAGLRRSMPAGRAMLASAAIFAVIHPAIAMLPVFVLGLCAAWAYERTRTLLAPMLVHALYNAAMIAAQS